MIVMGGCVGSGIFINPYVVARQVHTPVLILGAWLFGGLIALGGIIATALTYHAAVMAGGGTYMLYWGMIAWGVIEMCMGLGMRITRLP